MKNWKLKKHFLFIYCSTRLNFFENNCTQTYTNCIIKFKTIHRVALGFWENYFWFSELLSDFWEDLYTEYNA